MSLADIRYAEALADISFQDGTIDSYRSVLKSILNTFQSQDDFRWFLMTPEISKDIKKETLQKLFGNELDDRLLRFIMLLIEKSRISYLPGIVEEFNKQADIRKKVLNIIITSAAPLEESQVGKITEIYRLKHNAFSARAEVVVDESIIGGIIVRIGDKVYDSSVKGRLKALNNIIVEN